jgi:hypothetical protein
LIQAVILDLQEKILLAEHVGVAVGQALGFLVSVGEDGFVDVAAQAGGHRDQAFGVPGKQIFIDARFVIETFEERGGNQLEQITIAFLVLAQQHQVVVAIGIAAARKALLRDVDLATDHRMHSLLLRFVVELDRAEEVAVVRHGDGGHLLLDHQVHQLADLAGAIKQRVVGVAMQVDERCY